MKPNALRILFAGTTQNAAETLSSLIESGAEIVGVLTRIDAPLGRKAILTPSPVADVATSHNLPLLKANSVDEPTVTHIKELNPDVGVVVAYGSLLKRNALDSVPLGWLNVHFSLLPAYRGAAPVQHALLNGEKTTGVTIFRLDEGMDSGPVLATASLEIEAGDNSGTLLKKLTSLGIRELVRCLELDLSDTVFLPQSSDGITFAPKIGRQDARIHPRQHTAPQASAIVRAMNPEPMAWLEVNGQPMRIITATLAPGFNGVPGQLQRSGSQVLLGCAEETSLQLELVQPAGKNPMSALSWHNGLKDQNGIEIT